MEILKSTQDVVTGVTEKAKNEGVTAKTKNMKVDAKAYRTEDFDTAQAINLIPETTKIRNHLERYGSITSEEARRLYAITRLSAIIYKLRYKEEPYMNIITINRYGKNRYGKNVSYGEYFLVRDKDA